MPGATLLSFRGPPEALWAAEMEKKGDSQGSTPMRRGALSMLRKDSRAVQGAAVA